MTKIHKRGRYSAALKEKVSLEALKGEKTLQQIASENNISPELVRQWKKQAQEGVSQIFKRSKSREKALEEQNELLKSLLCKRKLELEWLTKKIQGAGSLVQRRQLLDEENSELPRKRQCELLSLHRSGTYYKPRAKADETPIEKALNELYIYRGYLQIACCDLTRSGHPCLWLLAWDPTQTVATRPLAIRKDGSWFAYGWDLTKNICEVFGPAGYIRTAYTYSPYGKVTNSGDVEQPIQWSSEYSDSEIDLVYYNYRHYSPLDGRWLGRDFIDNKIIFNLYRFVTSIFDWLGLWTVKTSSASENTAGKILAHLYGSTLADDRFATLFFRWWVMGNVDEVISKDDTISDYLSIHPCIQEAVLDQLQELLSSDSNQVKREFHMELPENNHFSGYGLLHGSNSDVNDFQMEGTHQKHVSNGCCIHDFNITYTWNDIMDPNLSYFSDLVAGMVIEMITSAKDYKIHISWNKETQIIEKNGVITQISGYTAGLTKANCNSSSFWRRSRSWRRR